MKTKQQNKLYILSDQAFIRYSASIAKMTVEDYIKLLESKINNNKDK